MNGLSILGTGRCLPDHIVTNDDLARRVETSNDWIVSRTGIRERRFAQGETLTQLAVAAARRAMEALLRRGAQTLILGCTELPLAETLYHLDYPVTDPTLELALAAIRFAGGETVE